MKKIVLKIGAIAVGSLPVISLVSCDTFKKEIINREKLVEDIYKKFGYELPEKNKKENIKIIIDLFDGGFKNINKEELKDLYIKEGWKEKDAQIFIKIIFDQNIWERILKKGFADLKVKTKEAKDIKFNKFVNSILPETIENNKELFKWEFFTKIFVGFDNVKQFKNILTKWNIKLPSREILDSLFLEMSILKKGLLYSSVDDLSLSLSKTWDFFKKFNEIEDQNFNKEIIEFFKLFENIKKDDENSLNDIADDELDINKLLSQIDNSILFSGLHLDAKEEAEKIHLFINGGLLAIMKNNYMNYDANEFDNVIDKYLKVLNEGLDNWEEKMKTVLEYKGIGFGF